MNITEATERACKLPTMLDALTYICVWESERAIKQAKKGLRDADGKGWDTCFKACLKSVMERYGRQWVGDVPTKCDLCGGPLTYGFVDGKTAYGPWAIMCFGCCWKRGVGVGLGVGQHYSAEGVKVAG